MQPTISSLQNTKIKNLVKLRRRRQRDRQKLMLIDGVRALELALQNGFEIKTIYFAAERAVRYSGVLHLARLKHINLQPVSAIVFDKIGYGDNPDGILGLAPQPNFTLDNFPCPDNPLYVVAEGLEKPGNLGAILRSADAAGITGLIICNPQTDIYNPNVIRASRGTFFSVLMAQAGVEEIICWLRENDIQILAASPDANLPYTQADMRLPTAVILGAEHAGLTEAWLDYTLISIPVRGQADSLNVAQAASILMFEAIRQREPAFTSLLT